MNKDKESTETLCKPETLIDYITNYFSQCVDIAADKNHDYACKTDAFHNLTAGERLGIGDTEQGFLFRMTDKFQRIINQISHDAGMEVVDESLEDDLQDLCNYAAMLSAYMAYKRGDLCS